MTVPNLITIGRLLLVPVAIWLILSEAFGAAFWVFITAGISDGIDGFIAKRFDQRSALGAVLDPVADKALLASVYITLGMLHHLPYWLVIMVVARDVMILGGFVILGMVGEPPQVKPLFISKLNTVLQIALAGLALLRLAYVQELYGLVEVLIWGVAASTLLSGAAYLIGWARTGGGRTAA